MRVNDAWYLTQIHLINQFEECIYEFWEGFQIKELY